MATSWCSCYVWDILRYYISVFLSFCWVILVSFFSSQRQQAITHHLSAGTWRSWRSLHHFAWEFHLQMLHVRGRFLISQRISDVGTWINVDQRDVNEHPALMWIDLPSTGCGSKKCIGSGVIHTYGRSELWIGLLQGMDRGAFEDLLFN